MYLSITQSYKVLDSSPNLYTILVIHERTRLPTTPLPLGRALIAPLPLHTRKIFCGRTPSLHHQQVFQQRIRVSRPMFCNHNLFVMYDLYFACLSFNFFFKSVLRSPPANMPDICLVEPHHFLMHMPFHQQKGSLLVNREL